ncbi:unnamed protein product [Mytilus coruscus]|uniref:Uncharacterized protein n=1 Tax=Mytilus coruscus TaxID=42192 RepID=A0A6J8EIB2_MYTCO|nr:unnamed protein product [Mytilus coruscus]
MSDAGLTDRSIMFMSDHHWEESLKSYCRRPSTDQKYKISSVLDNVATGNSSSAAALVPYAPSSSAAIFTLPNNVTETVQSVFTKRTTLHSIDMPNHNVLVNSQSNLQTSKMSGFAANSVFQNYFQFQLTCNTFELCSLNDYLCSVCTHSWRGLQVRII